MPDFARSVLGLAGYRVPVDDPSARGAHARELYVLEERLKQAAAGGGAGGFKLDVEQMQALLPQWQELRDTLDRLRRLGNKLEQLNSPADDESSMANNAAALAHAEQYRLSIDQQWQYAVSYVKSLEKMIEKYRESDHFAGVSLDIMGTDL
nr:PE family protein [uncultured bacterium]